MARGDVDVPRRVRALGEARRGEELVAEEEGVVDRARPRVVGVVEEQGPGEGVAQGRRLAREAPAVGREAREELSDPLEVRERRRVRVDLGSKRVIQRRFDLALPRARVPKQTFTLRDRSERCSLVEKSAKTSGKRPRYEPLKLRCSHPFAALV